ncbi:polyprenol monophosphomannose synthase [Corynebacterium tapiri]|uniref:dolichyl-phosphate beta-D-mannosyltransferase n=1 Tax=Corynebacterium tapiri TaxID=1448266 RepID=A0A5C4U4N7_9CORY|nr:polyprenol monophosphomannose synthase [Corynebacterium tapiri]TNL97625.1 polyprenol monophosphomannose synthase [Corynebacterium tapiri]
MANPSESTLVIIPTYNEIENLPRISKRVLEATAVDLLIVDDSSPDGTGEAADKLAAENERVHVLHRTEKTGLLGAYLAGFRWGLEREYDVLVEMDADGSHAPEQLHRLLDQIDEGADMVIGSRYVDGGEVVNWPTQRFVLSKGGNLYISAALGAGLSDMTAGYRAMRREVLETIGLDELSNAGYIFQVDMAFRAVQNGFDVREVPITFTEREYGESKLDGSFVKDSLLEVTKWGVSHRTEQVRNLAVALGDLGMYQYRKSSLPGVPSRIAQSLRNAGDFAVSTRELIEYELKKRR